MTSSPDPAIRESAIRLLARREHSRAELERKLAQRGWAADDVRDVLDDLCADGLQSDTRYAESFVRSRIARNYGPVRIQAELTERGVDRQLAAEALASAEVDWFALAEDWYRRKYATEPGDRKERSRRMQALGRRGFSPEHFQWLFE